MNGLSILSKNLAGRISENSPTILTGLAVAGLISTSILAVKATPKAMEILADERVRRNVGYVAGECDKTGLSNRDVIRTTWRCYIPTCAVGIASILCIVGANTVNMRRNAALAGIYAITDTAFKEYKTKIVETIGTNKELAVRDAISADRIKTHPSGASEIIFTGKGDVLCYDSLTGRYFKSSVEHIRQTINDLNHTLMTDMWISLNELYYELGLSNTELGGALGWDIDKGLIEVTFSTQLSEEKEPCLVLNYQVFPRFMK